MIGYGWGAAGQGSSYKFMGSYFVMFLTNCVMFDPATASMIASVALFVEAIVGMLVGNLSDHCTSSMGRRRPFILVSGIVIPIVLILITLTPELTHSLKVVYYMVLAILFRAFFSYYEIPYNALGSDIAKDYDARIRLRSLSRMFGVSGNIIGYISPLLILELFDSPRVGWAVTGTVVAISVLVSFLLCVAMTKGKDPVYVSDESRQKNVLWNIATSYWELLKLKPMKMMVAYKASVACALALFDVGMIYYLQYALQLSSTNSLFTFLAQAIIFLVMTPVINKMALALGKAKQQIYSFGFVGIIGLVFFLFFRKSLAFALVYVITFAAVQTGFWQISGSVFYDCVEVDQWVNGKRRQGDIMSLISVLGTLVSAVIVQVFGVLLEASGYDASLAVQSQGTVTFLGVEYILLPSLCAVAAALFLAFMPINKKRFASLQAAIACKEQGESYDRYLDDLKKVIGEIV